MNFNYVEKTTENVNFLKIHGRTLYDNGLFLSWSNSGVELKFKGNKIEFDFSEYTAEQPIYIKLYADDVVVRYGLPEKHTKAIYDFSSDKTHTVKLLRVSEGDVPLVLKSIRICGKAPEFLVPPHDKMLKLEFLGDSITAGWGVLANKDRNQYYTFEQDSTMTYAFLTAEYFNADIRTVCYSGQGVFKNCAGDTGYRFRRIFNMNTRVRDGFNHSDWTPDVMVLNCGTNDVPGGTTYDEMFKEGEALIDDVRKAYKDAKIVWVYGMMNDKFHDTFKKLVAKKNNEGDKNIYYLPLEKITAEKNEIGAVGHPNFNASVRVSNKLSKFILKILG